MKPRKAKRSCRGDEVGGVAEERREGMRYFGRGPNTRAGAHLGAPLAARHSIHYIISNFIGGRHLLSRSISS
jgi:hypothetical protein